jgi:predicted transcriptional regulator
MPTEKVPSSYRLSDECKDMLQRLADFTGGTRTAVLERLVRQEFAAHAEAIERREKKRDQK